MSQENTTLNETKLSNCSSAGSLTAAEKLGKTIAYCLLLVVSLTGNSLIGIIVYKTSAMRRTINYFIVNMAMSDLLYPIFVFPLLLTDMYGGVGFISGEISHTYIYYMVISLLQYLSCAVSIQSLFLIAVDRFRAVVFPLRRAIISSKMCPFVIVATWIIAFAFSFPIFLAFNFSEHSENLKWEWHWKEVFFQDIYSHIIPIVFTTTFFAILILLYSIILFKLKSLKTPGEQSLNAEQQRLERRKNVLKMAIAILLGFALCWLPLNVLGALGYPEWDNPSCGLPYFLNIALFLSHVNCAVNPCICFTFSGNYRQGLKSLFKWNGPL